MNTLHNGTAHTAYELRFHACSNERGALSFPCDVMGHVDMDRLGDRDRNNYLFARAVMKRASLAPEVVCSCAA